jgi:hypothetical protein
MASTEFDAAIPEGNRRVTIRDPQLKESLGTRKQNNNDEKDLRPTQNHAHSSSTNSAETPGPKANSKPLVPAG